MTTDKHKTVVVFRMLEGEAIALFPELPGTRDKNTCDSYMRLGQHSSADAYLSRHTKKAKPGDFEALKKELEVIGYNLDVRTRVTRHMHGRRHALVT